MSNLFLKHKYHFVVWLVLLLYLLSANQIYATFFLKHGKPVSSTDPLPSTFSDINYSIDIFSFLQYDGQETYYVKGWAFFDTDTPNPSSIQLILKGDGENYLYDAAPYTRKDVRSNFISYELDEKKVGFTAYISKHPIKMGLYQLGLILQDDSGLQYKDTHYFVKRTPNTLQFMDLAEYVSDPMKISVAAQNTARIKFNLDDVLQFDSNRPHLFSLIGWYFHEDESSDSEFEKLVQLSSDKETYVYQVETYKRADVTNAFSDLGRNLDHSGFKAYINPEKIKPGKYEISLILRSSESSFRTATNNFLDISAQSITLEKP
jgi:hypothetical protein